MYIEYTFIVVACILAIMIAFFKLYLQKQKRSDSTVKYTHVMIWFFVLYILSAFALIFITDSLFNKVIAVIFAISPFIIGKLATYEKETIYSYIQMFCAIISAGYVYILML